MSLSDDEGGGTVTLTGSLHTSVNVNRLARIVIGPVAPPGGSPNSMSMLTTRAPAVFFRHRSPTSSVCLTVVLPYWAEPVHSIRFDSLANAAAGRPV